MHLDTAHLAGFFTAHAIWSVSDGGPLVPMLVTQAENEDPKTTRLSHPTLEEAVEEGKRRLGSPQQDVQRAVLLYDGYITIDGEKSDAILVETSRYGASCQGILLAIPYRPREDSEGFAVHPPELLEFEGLEQDSLGGVLEAFFGGVETHAKGAKVWHESLAPGRVGSSESGPH